MKYLRLEQVLRIHERVIERSGGHPAIIDRGLIESAVAQPRQSFGGEPLYRTLHAKAAALAFSLCKNHGFQDGNKRTAHAAMEMFLLRNGWEIRSPVDEQESVFLAVAAGSMGRDRFTTWVGRNIRRRRR